MKFLGLCDTAGSLSPYPDERTGKCACKVRFLAKYLNC